MTNRMAKLERKNNEAIATIFREYRSCTRIWIPTDQTGQRLQGMKKSGGGNENGAKDVADEVNLVASLNAATTERAAEQAESDEE